MFCIKCGNEIPGDYVFCPKCGTPTINNKNRNHSETNHAVEEQPGIRQRPNKKEYISIMNNKSIKKILILVIGLIIIGVFFSLIKENPKTKKILNYVNGSSKKEFANIESKMIESFNSFWGDNSKTDQDVYDEISQKTIVYAKQLNTIANDMLREIDDEELRNVHKILIDYSDAFVQICTKMLYGIDNNDLSVIDEIKELKKKTSRLADEYWSELTALGKKNGVSIKKVD
ncbi:MAG: zinc ribbon domain-containing protein [Lachnospiraceae bacterium]|nr:zinc ribbon domain-containing protein [Lachnospiraceae bacterium]